MDMTRVLKLWILGWLAVCAPLLVLLFALDLDVSRSPAWQVGLFYLLFIPFTLMWGAWALYLFLPSIPGLWRHALVLGVSVLVLVSALGWWVEGGSLGFRTPPAGRPAGSVCGCFSSLGHPLQSGLAALLARSARGTCQLAGFPVSDFPDEVRHLPCCQSGRQCCRVDHQHHAQEVDRLGRGGTVISKRPSLSPGGWFPRARGNRCVAGGLMWFGRVPSRVG